MLENDNPIGFGPFEEMIQILIVTQFKQHYFFRLAHRGGEGVAEQGNH
jgi:hypothetical protein